MEAKDVSLLDIMNEDEKSRFIIPFFQRSYVWEKDNWDSLITDLKDNSNHFLGSLILKYDDNKRYEIDVIDGQQRLTTLSILLKVLYALSSDEDKKEYFDSCKSILFGQQKSFENGKKKIVSYPRILHSRFDKVAFEKVVGKIIKDENNIQYISSLSDDEVNSIDEQNDHSILCCYKYFYNLIKNKYNDEDKFKLLELLTTNSNHILVRIKLAKNDDEQNIFDTVNNSGKKLTCADIIKNKLFQRALELVDDGDENLVYNLYENEWESLFYKDEDYFRFWNAERQTGRVKRTNMEIFLYCVVIIKGKYTPSVDNLEKLDVPYKKILETGCATYQEVEGFIKDIINYAYSYLDLFKEIESEECYIKDEENYYLKRLLLTCKELEVSTFAPYILMVYSSNLPKEEKEDRYYELEKLLIKTVLCGLSTKNYNKNCVELIKDYHEYKKVFFDSSKFEHFDSDNSLYKLKNKQATLILFLIELSKIDKQNDIRSLRYIYSLEHIMPKDWSKYWSFTSVPSVDASTGECVTDVVEAEKMRKRHINSLGNMTLITKEFNSALKNKCFNDKRLGYGKYKGYKSNSSLYLTKMIIDNFDAGIAHWDEKEINNRLIILINDIKDIWF